MKCNMFFHFAFGFFSATEFVSDSKGNLSFLFLLTNFFIWANTTASEYSIAKYWKFMLKNPHKIKNFFLRNWSTLSPIYSDCYYFLNLRLSHFIHTKNRVWWYGHGTPPVLVTATFFFFSVNWAFLVFSWVCLACRFYFLFSQFKESYSRCPSDT